MTDAMVELLMRLERASIDEATSFVVVSVGVDSDPWQIINSTGPFSQAEQALADAGRQDADWREHADPGEEDAVKHFVVPLWEPEA